MEGGTSPKKLGVWRLQIVLSVQFASWGEIIVRLVGDGTATPLDVEDNGLGMSRELLSGPLLDFGASYWDSQLCSKEHPGLLARGFQPQGMFGVGFFSLFSLDTPFRQLQGMEIDDQSQWYIKQFHVAGQLRSMNGMKRLDRFCFNKQALVNQRVEAEWHLSAKLLVPDDYLVLILDVVVSATEVPS